jgi:hypothetical protein
MRSGSEPGRLPTRCSCIRKAFGEIIRIQEGGEVSQLGTACVVVALP